MTSVWDHNPNPALLASPADWISPGKEDPATNTASYRDDPPANDGSKVILNDTDHLGGAATPPSAYLPPWVWKSFTRGHHPILMDRLERSDVTDGSKNALMPPLRAALGNARSYACKMDLATMVPRNDLASSTYCLANPGQEYLVYLPDGGEVTVDLSAAAGPLRAEWCHPTTGETVEPFAVEGGVKRTFQPPFAGDAVLYLGRK
jgi:hypothetical protein